MRRLLIVLAVAGMLITPAWAEEPLSVPGLDQVWEQAEEYGIGSETDFTMGVDDLFLEGVRQAGSALRGSGITVLKLMAVVLLCSLAQGAGSDAGGLRVAELAGALTITALTMTDMEGMLGLGRTAIGRMGTFSEALLPVMAVLAAATGGVTAAAVRQSVTVLFSQLLLTAMDTLIIPLIYAYVTICCASAAIGTAGLDKLAGFIKSTAAFVLTTLLLAFVGYLTASGAIAGGMDASAIKAARMAITRMIPVVGGILADASETVLAGAMTLRSSVGAVGMLVVLAMCLVPFLHLAVHYLAYKVTAVLCALVAQPSLSRLIDAIGGAFGMVLGMTGASALILLISLVSALTAVVP